MRNLSLTTLTLLLVAAVHCPGQALTKYLVVEITEHGEAKQYEVLTTEGYKELKARIRQEARLHPKALALAKKAWEASEENEESFPRGAIEIRKTRTIGRPFTNQADAEKELAECEAKVHEKQERDAEKEKEKDKDLLMRARRGPQNSYKIRADRARERIARDKEREQLQRVLKEKARTLYDATLTELLKPEPEKTEDKAP